MGLNNNANKIDMKTKHVSSTRNNAEFCQIKMSIIQIFKKSQIIDGQSYHNNFWTIWICFTEITPFLFSLICHHG